MIRVHIWKGLYGHASLQFCEDEECEEYALTDQEECKEDSSIDLIDDENEKPYISFHPKDPENPDSIIRNFTGHLQMISTGIEPKYVRCLECDEILIEEATGTKKHDGQEHQYYDLYNLNEQAVLSHWANIITSAKKYNVINYNCSTVVAQCLTAGWIGNKIDISDLDEKSLDKYVKTLKDAILYQELVSVGGGNVVSMSQLRIRYPEDRPYIFENKSGLVKNIGRGGITAMLAGAGLTFVAQPWVTIPIFLSANVASTFVHFFGLGAFDPQIVEAIAYYLNKTVG